MATSSTRRSLVRRLSLRAAAWAGVLGLTLVTLAAWQYWRFSVGTLDQTLLAEARVLSDQIAEVDGRLDIALPLELRTRLDTDESYYAIFDATGQRLDGSAPHPPDGAPIPGRRTRAGYREAMTPGPRGTTVVVGRSLDSIRRDVRRLAISLLGASLIVILLALPLTVWLRRQLGQSIAQIDETARALTLGQPARLDTARIDDEFAGVARVLNQAFDGLEGALARERQLTSDVSHELRTPVATLVAETDWALGASRTADEYRRSLMVCGRQARRMKELTESLLTLARIEAGTLATRRKPVDLRTLAEDVVKDLMPLASERGVTIAVQGEATTLGDPVQLRILVSNLVSNAVRYNRRDGDVLIRIGSLERHVSLDVEDTGPGLNQEQAERVFSRFWRADPSRSARDGGIGLGLAISKAVVTAHGGTIVCRPVEPQGTAFSVNLPDGSGAC